MATCLADHLADQIRRLRVTAPDLPPGPPTQLVEAVDAGRMVYSLERECGVCGGVGEGPDGLCECYHLRRLAVRLTRCGLPAPDGRPLPWEDLRSVPITPTNALDMRRLATALGVADANVDALAERVAKGKPVSMMLYGANAAGKTTFVGVLARAWVARGASLRWWRWPDLLRTLRDAQRQDDGDGDIIGRLVAPGPDVLVLDEVGRDNNSPFVARTAEAVIGTRLERGAATVLITNETPAVVNEIVGDIVFSRLARLAKTVPFGVGQTTARGQR